MRIPRAVRIPRRIAQPVVHGEAVPHPANSCGEYGGKLCEALLGEVGICYQRRMKRSIVTGIVVGAVFIGAPHLSWDRAPTKAERFGLELEACQRVYAAGTPDKCQLYGAIKVVDHHEDVKRVGKRKAVLCGEAG